MSRRVSAVGPLFEEWHIDYCCGGGRTMADACKTKGGDAEQLVTRLHDAHARPADESTTNCSEQPLSELCDHIVSTHHAFLKTELPRLGQVVDKVAQVHGEAHSELSDVRTVFIELREELEPHMMKEEQIRFPAIRTVEQQTTRPQFLIGAIANPIWMMEHEHDHAGDALNRLRQLNHEFDPPTHACNTWRVILDGLHHLESDLHQHIQKENNILFPWAQQLENSLS